MSSHIEEGQVSSTEQTIRLPRENLYRASYPSIELRGEADGRGPQLFGHFAVFDDWTEINSPYEGRFMERVAPGAFSKTIQENGSGIRLLFQHGRDPQLGDKPIGKFTSLREDAKGGYYEADLFDGVPPLVVAGLRAGEYGASFRFNVTREDVADEPGVSSSNPSGIPERTIREAKLHELGPVTWGAYKSATAGVRSITDLIHDIDAVSAAAAILLDEERLGHAQAFISRGVPLDAQSTDRGSYDAAQRKEMAEKGWAMPDGSYPINDAADVKSAIGLNGHSATYSTAEVKAHIIKNAKRLGLSSMIPDDWQTSANEATIPTAPPNSAAATAGSHRTTGRREQGIYPHLKSQRPKWELDGDQTEGVQSHG
jgi:HK97 family phage prohead protease